MILGLVAWGGICVILGASLQGRGGAGPGVEEGPAAPPAAPPGRIEVDLARQRLRALSGGKLVHEFSISSGSRDRTPKGTFRVWRKHRMKDMKVGLPVLGKYYTLEDVPWIMYYEGDDLPREKGFAIHGAYWHADFGRPVSHGCINLSVPDARELFFWAGPSIGGELSVVASDANPGTEVVVF
jgi:lipoprotein-anchoring transpeptidase ErfK/SrfK